MDASDPDDGLLAKLKGRRDDAYDRWLALRRDPECLRDPAKRSRMLQARLAYLDASAEYIFVMRESQGKKSIDG